jgi:hypothetical protein
MKTTLHFIKLIQDINLQNEDYLVSFDVASLCTNIPVEEVLQVIRNRLNTDKFISKKRAMGNSLSLVVSIYLWNTLRKQHWIQQTINPLNSSDMLTTLPWTGHMDQKTATISSPSQQR